MTAPLLEVTDLAIDFNGQATVRGVSFTLDRGETLALVGESGSGKSVSALSILQLLPYPTASHPAGSIRFEGRELLGAAEPDLIAVRGDRIGMIFQEPMTSLNPLHTVEKQIGETLLIHRGMDAPAARARTLELLELVGIADPESRLRSYPHQLSGGQRQRVMIAMALANEPDLLIADEPTTALDVTIQQQILELLSDLQQRLGMALLLISHDLGIVRRMADRVAVMHRGQIVEQGQIDAIFDTPQHPYTIELLNAEPSGRQEPVADDAPEVLAGNDIRVWFPIQRGLLRRTVGHVKAVDGVDLHVRAGETLGIVGESGSGKTTLGLALLRLIDSRGDIRFDGTDLRALDKATLRARRADIQIVFQDPFASLDPRFSISQVIAEGLRVHFPKLTETQLDDRIRSVLGEVGLDADTRHRYPHEFSGGQRQRIAIARALVLEPRLLILDEPTSALDRSVQSQIVDLLRALQSRRRLAYLFISHDLKIVRALAHRVIVMKDGHVVETGDVENLFTQPRHDYTRRLIAAALFNH
ncbi:MAG: ABC transporter ATP-binding protein [Gammaproteobacteria bacterium]|nr:ABC transporter ATP-binding protein [Gammaproteobacteria bacterium]